MKKYKNRIFHQEWQNLHPHSKPASSDFYFVKLSNTFLEMVDDLFPVLSEKTKKRIALSVAAYFEDIISKFGLWNGFTRKHYQMYGKYLPFYELSGSYLPEEINIEDVMFLIWSIMQMETLETEQIMINPENIGIAALGLKMFLVLEDEYETAPENEMLYNFFTESVNYESFFTFRPVISWLYYNSYLIMPYTDGKLKEALKDVKNNNEYTNVLTYTITNELIFRNPCGPLALKTYEWLSAIVDESTTLGKMLLETQIRCKKSRIYLVTDVNDAGVTLLPYDNDEPIFLLKEVFTQGFPYKTGDTVICNLVYYNKKWELNGFIVNATIQQYEKEREEAKRQKENATYSMNLFLKANDDKPIRYFRNGKEYEDFFKIAFKLPKKMKENPFKGYKNLVSFINAEYGTTTIADLAIYIKDKDNPCYNKKIADKYGLCVFSEIELFKELIDYLIKNQSLPDLAMNSLKGKERGSELVQKNLDFLFRFLQPQSFAP